ncbi:MAG: aldehyde dehydrogenase family protein [Bacteroidota bacterium]
MQNTFQVISPVDGSIYVERAFANHTAIEKTLSAAQKAQKSWQQTSVAERAAICRKVVAYFLEHAEEIGAELTWQMGRPIRYTPFEITKGFQERANYMIDIAAAALSPIQIPKVAGFQRYIQREALGTVLVLAPWNYPYVTAVNAIIPAIMAGNTVILKHAEQTPLCAERYAEAFTYADAPKGVFQFLHISHEQVASVIQDERIDFVAFTGSVKGGRAVSKAVGNRLIGAGLELGGKDPAYVRADASLESAVENLVDGAFFNSGQSCCGIERIYVHESQYDDFVEAFVALAQQYVLANPLESGTTLGPMVRTAAAESAQRQINQAIAQGATALIDSQNFKHHQTGTPYMAPQVLVDVHHDMEVMQVESFAPVVGIMPVKNDQVALQLMNDSAYGLTASIWTTNVKKAIELGNQIETGTVFMNRCDYLDPALAWTGVKNSGRGCTLSAIGYESLTRPKSFHLRMM